MGAETGKVKLRPKNPGENLKVAVTVLKRRDSNLKAKADRAAKIAKAKQKKKKETGKLNIVRAESLIKSYRINLSDKRRLKRQRKKKQPKDPQKVSVPKGQKIAQVIAVVRNGRKGGSKEVKKMLRALRLAETNTLVFMPNTKEALDQLLIVQPFVFYGPPTFKTVTDLFYKRAKFKAPESSDKVLLSDNSLVETHLGSLGMLCVEDLVHTVFQANEHFAEVNQRLWPWELGDIRKAGALLTPDKDHIYGNIKDAVNDKIFELLGS